MTTDTSFSPARFQVEFRHTMDLVQGVVSARIRHAFDAEQCFAENVYAALKAAFEFDLKPEFAEAFIGHFGRVTLDELERKARELGVDNIHVGPIIRGLENTVFRMEDYSDHNASVLLGGVLTHAKSMAID